MKYLLGFLIILFFGCKDSQIAQNEADGNKLKWKDNGQTITIFRNGETPVLSYQYGNKLPPGTFPLYYQRSGFIHPLYSPEGIRVTEGFPLGHMHQHGIFMAFTKTKWKDFEVDFWNQALQTGTVVWDKLIGVVKSKDEITIRSRHQHVILQGPDTIPVLSEIWIIRVKITSRLNIVDLESKLNLLGDEPLIIKEYHYGGFAFRGRDEWEDTSQVVIQTNLENDRTMANHTRPGYVSLKGKVADDWVYLVASEHPDNFRHPQPVRIHPTMPYFCFAPMVLGEYQIDPGTEYISRYQILISDEAIGQRELDKWINFVQ